MFSSDMPNCVFDLEARNRKANAIITSYAMKHAATDVGIGVAGFVPIPGAATVALLSAIALQAPLIYTPMTQELAVVYNTSPDSHTKDIIRETVEMGAMADLGVEFIKEIALDLIMEAGAGVALSAIPFVGGIFAAGLDATIAATLTWRVGTMVAAYYQNGGAWINSRRHTYELASAAVGGFSPQIEGRADVNDFAQKDKTIAGKHLKFALSLVEMMKGVMTRGQIRDALQAKAVPNWLIESALKQAYA